MRSKYVVAVLLATHAACDAGTKHQRPGEAASEPVAHPATSPAGGAATSPAVKSAPPVTLAALASVAGDPAAIARMASAGGSQAATMAWDVFLYLGWPAKGGERGVPDPSQSLGATPAVWQTWKESQETYLTGGVAPPPWDDGGPQGPATAALTMIDGTTLQDVDGNPITYSVRLNQSTFDYILSRQLYGWTGQAALRQPGATPVAFPAAAMEVKAAWKILDPVKDRDRMNHYLVAQVRMAGQAGPTTLTVGLTGLHIMSKALPNWVWITFEQVENPTTTGARLLLPIDPAVAEVNAQFQAAVAGTPYAYYQLNGVQTEYTAGDTATLLANTQIETSFQTSSSCITCHARASVSAGATARLPLFSLAGGDLAGYIGAPDLTPFGPGKDQYSALDFVWSMREAKQ